MKFISNKTILIFLVLLFISLEMSFAQKECKCDTIFGSEKLELIKRLDSSEMYQKIETLKEKRSDICTFEALQLEFDFLLAHKKIEQLHNTISKLKDIAARLSCNDKLDYSVFYNQTLYHRANNNYEKLSEYAFKALKEAEQLKNDDKSIQIIKQIVFLFTRMKENQKRWSYVKQAEKLIFKNEENTNSIANYRWLAYEYENEYTKTERKTLIDSGLIFINTVKKRALKSQSYDELAMLYRASEAYAYHEGELKNALKHIDSAIYYAKKIKGRKNLSGFYLSKSWDHYDLKQFKEASKWMDTALHFDDKTDIAGHMMMLSEASQIYEGSGALNKAMLSLKSHSKLKDSILSKQRSKAINELETKYQTELKDAKIKQLTVLLVLALFGIVSLFLIGTLVRLRQSKKQNEALKIAFKKQIALEKELSDVRDDIAQDFHDDLGNKLARISLLSNLVSGEVSINDPKVKSKIKQITEDANGLYNGTRDFVFSLKSKSDHIEEIVTYLSDFGEDFFGKTKVKFIVQKEISQNVRLPHYWNKQLIFIFKEALTNALKHSKCNTVTLAFTYIDNELNIVCKDDGIGISEANINSCNGLLNMKKRASKIGGVLTIENEKNGETSISFVGKLNS